jgi:hypothetical protein
MAVAERRPSPTSRSQALQQVHAALANSGLGFDALRGSWRFGDYHFDLDSGTSFSDLDLLVLRPPKLDPDAIGRLCDSVSPLVKRVSVKPVDEFSQTLTLESATWVAVAAFVARMTHPPCHPVERTYVLAKVLLHLHRRSVPARYGAIAAQIATRAARGALHVKLGWALTLPAGAAADLLRSAPPVEPAEIVADVLKCGASRPEAIGLVVDRILHLPDLHAVTRRHLAQLLGHGG